MKYWSYGRASRPVPAGLSLGISPHMRSPCPHTCVHTHTCTHACTHTFLHPFVCVCKCMCMHCGGTLAAHWPNMETLIAVSYSIPACSTHVCTHVCTHVRTHVYTRVGTQCACMYTCLYMCLYRICHRASAGACRHITRPLNSHHSPHSTS